MHRSAAFLFITTVTLFSGCKALTAYTNVLTCDFRMHSLKEPAIAGIDVQQVNQFSDLSFMQAGRLTTAYLSGNLPLSFKLNLEAKNPNVTEARLAQFDWIVHIDDTQIAAGTNEQEYTIPPDDGKQMIPLTISVNLLDVLNGQAKDALFNFGLNMANASDVPTRVRLQIKPTVYVGAIPVTYPGYIDLGTEFGK